MSLWLAARRWRRCLLVVLVVALSLLVLGSHTVPLPALLAGLSLPVPLSVFLPLALPIVLVTALAAGDPLAELTARRRMTLLDAAFALALVLVALASFVVLAPLLDQGVGATAARDTLGYAGLALLAAPLLGNDIAASIPVGYAIAASLFGRQGGEDVAWWAWPVAPGSDRAALVMAVVLLGLGETATALRGIPLLRNRSIRWAHHTP